MCHSPHQDCPEAWAGSCDGRYQKEPGWPGPWNLPSRAGAKERRHRDPSITQSHWLRQSWYKCGGPFPWSLPFPLESEKAGEPGGPTVGSAPST